MSASNQGEVRDAGKTGRTGWVPMDAYDYGLPEGAIAQAPVEPRSAARLLVSGRVSVSGRVDHATMADLPALLRAGDVVVVNDTRVLAARLRLVKATGGEAEVLLLEPIDGAGARWEALVRPGRRLPPGTRLYEPGPTSADDHEALPHRGPVVEIGAPVVEIGAPVAGHDDGRRSVDLIDPTVIERAGLMPLPPYIHRRLDDPERYQTVYAAERDPGERSTAAPTAGLHFTPELLRACREAGAEVVTVDLAIGLDTFRPITAPTPAAHVIHTERYRVSPATMDACAAAGRVVAVGTTVVRALESAAATGRLSGRTDLFIHGEHTFRVVDLLVTNFHLPRSSLLLLVEAFCGEEWRQLYTTALDEGYRFLSFGDAMVVARAGPKGTPVARVDPGSMTAARLEITATDGLARTGVVHTARGSYPVPTFMPVGTRGTVKALDPGDLETLGVDVVLANTYHLMLRPGAEVVAALGGLQRFTGWNGHSLTDSGGYQVHSLAPEVDDGGVSFASVYDGTRLRLTPEMAVEAQGLIGADIQMVLDVCATLPATPEALRQAVDRTAAWAARARAHHDRLEARPEHQALFGIVQGGTDPKLRVESARRTVALGFDGYGIGGLSVGEPRPEMLETLAVTVPELPAGRLRYLMGIGDPVGLMEAIGLGVDQFDCVAPTRMARHGSILTSTGRLNLRNATYARDDRPLDAACDCSTCSRWSRGYLRHLVTVGEPTAWRLLSIHNLAYVVDLMFRARTAIAQGRFSQLRSDIAEVWA